MIAYVLPALAGGALIGASAAMFLLLQGRIAGISGILGSLLRAGASPARRFGDAAFLLGLLGGPWLLVALGVAMPPIRIATPWPLLILAGLLVGYGTRLGSGCTSGHGVCGMARLAPRSFAAVATFMAVAIATTFVVRHVLGGL
ncbi:MAG: YeeE/YedE family protein [Rhodospirillales bacterium]|nr:YeeE/YedE family protein [Rhodospirillales bacterium]